MTGAVNNRGARVRRRGFTLVEAMVSLAVLGMAVGAILTPISMAIQQQQRTAKMTVATVLAEQCRHNSRGKMPPSPSASV